MVSSLATRPQRSAAHAPAEAQLARYSDGSIVALSLSEPGRTYRVELDPPACECPAWQYRRCCYHVRAAAARYALDASERWQRQSDTMPVAKPDRCGNCGKVVDAALDIAPMVSTETRGSSPFWRCGDLNACVAVQQAARAAYSR